MEVKLLDLTLQYEKIRGEILEAVEAVFSSQQFILGSTVERFEKKTAEYCGADFAVGTASGTDSILLALMALGIGPGDEVIATPYSFFSTVSSIVRVGATPVFADIDPRTYNIDPQEVAGAFTERTKAVIAVHLFGQAAEMNKLKEIASGGKASVIEDACQSIGALYHGKRCGTIGDIGCFSFFPSKNLGGAGDGGMVITDNGDIAEKIRALRVHGEEKKYSHKYVGINSRLDAIQAAVLEVKLKYLEGWNAARRSNASKYDKEFSGLRGIRPPFVEEYNESTFNQYVIRTPKRDQMRRFLKKKGIGTAVYYPIPLNLQECFHFPGWGEGVLPESERAAEETLALPIYPELSDKKQDYVIEAVKEFLEENSVDEFV
ncbi:MAG: DegT/DnrJ/EryC1/StrS family aminotransferase [Candidatus Krumholzibacteriota bacterium]|nr:DegT/DnrJ/EryC1/StrS family aminotransferase [Candidatus Krumholzibacteriota bacterium]